MSWARILWLVTAAAFVAAQSGLLRTCSACETLGKACCEAGLAAMPSSGDESSPVCPLCRAQAAGGHRQGQTADEQSGCEVVFAAPACETTPQGGCDCQLAPREQEPVGPHDGPRPVDEPACVLAMWPQGRLTTPDQTGGFLPDAATFAGFLPRPARILYGVWRN